MEEEILLDLAAPRTIAITDRGQHFLLTCRRITDADWLAYFNGITVSSEQSGRERINVVDVNTPRLALAEAVLTSATGYKVAGDVELTSLPNWQKKIPIAHRLKLGEILSDCRPSKTAEFTIHPEGEVVALDATWSSTNTADGPITTERFVGLKHTLKTPSEEQYRRYAREASRSTVVGGSRSGKTLYKGAQPLLAKLYDELVISVDGYVAGESLLQTSPDVIREMDMLHKVMAAQELFQPQESAAIAEREDE